MQKPIPSTLRSSGCKEYKDNRGSNLLSAKMCETCEDVGQTRGLLCKMFAAVLGRSKIELEPILGKKFMGYAVRNFSDFERHKQRGSTATDYNAVVEKL